MESPTGIEDSPEIIGSLRAVRFHCVVHQYLGIAHDGRCWRAQFLPHIGNERPLRSAVGPLLCQISRDTTSPSKAPSRSPSAQPAVDLSKAAILPSRRDISTGLVS